MSQEIENPSKALNCGSCVGLMREKVMPNLCSELGRLPSSRACKQHVPDAFTLMQDNESRILSMVDMGLVFRRMSPNDLQILAALLMNERKTRKAGFYFMQKVYIRVAGNSGRNYLSNFVMGYVLDATKEQVRVVSETSKTAVVLPNDKNSQSLYTAQQFAAIRREIGEGKKWVDPDVIAERRRVRSTVITDLDTADAEGLLETPTAARRKIKKVKQKDDLVTFVAKLNRGVIKTQKDAANYDEEITIGW